MRGRRDEAAAVGDAVQHGFHAGLGGLGDVHVLDAEIGLAARQAELALAPFRTPDVDAVGGLGGELVGGIAEEQKVRMPDLHWVPPRAELRADTSQNSRIGKTSAHGQDAAPGGMIRAP